LLTLQPDAQRAGPAFLEKTGDAAPRGEFELFKTTSIFDSTATHPEWLGEEPQHVKEMMPM
jgi:hypothetical protein